MSDQTKYDAQSLSASPTPSPVVHNGTNRVQLPRVQAVWSESKNVLRNDNAFYTAFQSNDETVATMDDGTTASASYILHENHQRDDGNIFIKQEVIDLDIEPYYYEEEDVPNQYIEPAEPVRTIEQRVGFDRGLEADHIAGATQIDGKLMFLVVWKNSESGEADLLDSSLVYKRCPQIAIKFFEERLTYVSPLISSD